MNQSINHQSTNWSIDQCVYYKRQRYNKTDKHEKLWRDTRSLRQYGSTDLLCFHFSADRDFTYISTNVFSAYD